MMYIHYCQSCHRIHILNGHKTICPTCESNLLELKISYMDYINLDSVERQILSEKLKNPKHLETLKISNRA